MQIYNLNGLSKYIEEDNGINKVILEQHVLNKENEKIDKEEYVNQVIKDYEEIIDYSKYSIEFIIGIYPNESIRPETNINEYFLIRKLWNCI